MLLAGIKFYYFCLIGRDRHCQDFQWERDASNSNHLIHQLCFGQFGFSVLATSAIEVSPNNTSRIISVLALEGFQACFLKMYYLTEIRNLSLCSKTVYQLIAVPVCIVD
jgi:hypothetical protein